MKNTFSFQSFEELELNGYVWQKVNGEQLKGVVLIVHGMAETIDRYDAFAEYLAKNSYVVFGINQRGHGPNADMLGYLGDNGWYKMREDLKHLVEMVKTEHVDLPVFVIGHSMGSFLTRDFLLDYTYLIDGAILSGTSYFSKLELKLGQWLSNRDIVKHGDRHISKFIDNLAFGKNNKKIKDAKTPFDWLSRDPAIVAEYIADPLCGQVHPSSFFYQFFTALERILYDSEFSNFKSHLPLFILSGDMDPVGLYGKGVETSAEKYKALGFDTQIKLYKEGRHEMLNETNRSEVFRDIVAWLDAHI
jgi:alpha-beta hydrolase superfamily lysophospholipase